MKPPGENDWVVNPMAVWQVRGGRLTILFPREGRRVLLPPSSATGALLGFVQSSGGGPLPPLEQETLVALRECGALLPAAADRAAEPPPQLFSRLHLDVEVPQPPEALERALDDLLQEMRRQSVDTEGITMQLCVRPRSEVTTVVGEVLPFLHKTLTSLDLNLSLVQWQLRVQGPSADDHGWVQRVVSQFDAGIPLSVMIDDFSEFGTVDQRWRAYLPPVEVVASLAAEGIDCRVNVHTTGLDGLLGRIERWLEANQFAGVDVEPSFSASRLGLPTPSLATEEDVDRLSQMLSSLVTKLERVLVVCEPWKSIAAAPVTRPWSSRRAALLADEGWTRSLVDRRQVALAGLLARGAGAGQASSSREGDGNSWPECNSCPCMPVCDGYESGPANAAGDPKAALLAARLNCAIRMDLLPDVLEAIASLDDSKERSIRTLRLVEGEVRTE